MISFANSNLKLPSRKVLAGQILTTNSQTIKDKLLDAVQKDLFGVMICFDGWKNIKKQEIIGSILITSNGQVLVWEGEDMSGNHLRWEEIKAARLVLIQV